MAGAVLCSLALSFIIVPGAYARPDPGSSESPFRPGIPALQEVRTVWTSEFGLPRPSGVAYLPSRNELLVADERGGVTSVLRLNFREEAKGDFTLPPISAATLAVDATSNLITGLNGGELVTTRGRNLRNVHPATDRTDVGRLGVGDPQGAAYDPATGTWFVLDGEARAIVKQREPGARRAVRIPLRGLGGDPRGLAFNPEDGLLYVGIPSRDRIFAVDIAGVIQAKYSTASTGLSDPRAMVFAPSSDTTDDPSALNLFVADAGGATTLGGVTELTLEALDVDASTLVVEEVTASLVQVIDTSLFDPPSPDPSGITYLPGVDRLMIADSEVDEETGAGYHGVNMWRLSRNGIVDDTGTTLPHTDEPTGLGYDPATNTLFVSTDSGNPRRILLFQPGPDGRFGTPDDLLVSTINTSQYGSTDTEDPEFDPVSGHLFFIDGVSTEVFRIDPVNGVFGDGDDIVTSFDVGQYGAVDIEGFGSDQARGTLIVGDRRQRLIYEVTKQGELVRIIDARVPGMTFLSGLTMAPASNGSGQMNYWIVDRAVDNGPDPNENDGKLFELSLEPSGNASPVIDSVVIDQTSPRTNDLLTVSVSAHDDDGDPLTFSYQWRKNGLALLGEEGPTLDLSVPGNGDKQDAISVRVVASDGAALSPPITSSQVTIVNTFPVFDQDLQDRTDAEGAPVSFSAGASDADGDTLGYEATGLPPGVNIDPATGMVSGTIAAGAASGGPYLASVTVRDNPDEDPGGPEPDPPPPISQVQAKAGDQSGVTSFALTYDSPPTPGNLLVAFGHYGANRVPTIPPGWSLALESNTPGETVVFYKVAGASEPSTVTYSISGSGTFMSLSIFEYAGLHDVQSEVLDRAVFTSASSATTVSTGTTQTTTQPNELLLASVGLNGTRTFLNTWTNGFSRQTAQRRQTVADRIVSETGQYQTAESWNTSVGTSVGSLVTFLPAGGGPAQPPPEPDPNPGSATDTFTWTVTAGSGSNAAPVVDSVAIDQSTPRTNDTLTATVTAHDDDGDPLTYAYQWQKNGVDLPGQTSATLDLSLAGNGDKGDAISVRVTASDGSASSTPVTSSPVTVGNSEPVFTQDLADRTNAEGDVINLSAAAADADGDPLTYAASGLPAGLSIDPSTGLISGTVAAGAAGGSPYSTAITVRDGPDVDATDTFVWTVTADGGSNAAPVIDSVAIDQSDPKTNDTLTVTVTAHDDDGDPLTYAYQWQKNGVDLPGQTSATLDLSLAGNGDKGDAISVRVTASDGSASSTPVTSSPVTVGNSEPVFTQDLADRTNSEGDVINLSAAAADADGDPLTYAASGLPAGLSIDPSTGLISGTVAAGAAGGSPYSTAITVRDGPDVDATDTFTWTVTASTPPDPPAEITQVQAKAGDQSGVTSFSLTYDSPPTAGNLLVAFGHYGANRTPTIPAGWSLALESNTPGETVVFYRVAGLNQPSTVTMSVSGSGVFMSLSIFEYAGLHDVQSEVLDRAVFTSASSATTVSTGTTQTTTQPNELLLASVGLNGKRTFQNTWTNGFVRQTAERRQTVAHRIVSETGQYQTAESWDTSVGVSVGVMITFRGG